MKKSDNLFRNVLNGALAVGFAFHAVYTLNNSFGSGHKESNFISFSEADSYAVLKKEEKVEIARNNPEYRQKFLDQIVSNYDFKNCSGLIYDPERTNALSYVLGLNKGRTNELIFPLNVNSNFDILIPRSLSTLGKGEKTPIFIGKSFFEGTNDYFKLDSDVKNYLTLYAYPQCKIHAEGFPGVSSSAVVSNFNQGKINPVILDRVNSLHANYASVLGFFEGKDKLSKEYMYKMSYDFTMDKLYLTKLMTNGVSSVESNIIRKAFRNVKGIEPDYTK